MSAASLYLWSQLSICTLEENYWQGHEQMGKHLRSSFFFPIKAKTSVFFEQSEAS